MDINETVIWALIAIAGVILMLGIGAIAAIIFVVRLPAWGKSVDEN